MKQIEQLAAVATTSERREEESSGKLTAMHEALREAGRTTLKIEEELSVAEEAMQLAEKRIAFLTRRLEDIAAKYTISSASWYR
jgi:hypothetical protein